MLYRTKFGRAVRASLQNRTAADLIGIDVNRVRTISVGIGVAVTAVGGMVFGATNSFNPNTGYDLISRLLAIVILGGMGSIGGAMAAAVLPARDQRRGRRGLVADVGAAGVLRGARARAVDPAAGPVRPHRRCAPSERRRRSRRRRATPRAGPRRRALRRARRDRRRAGRCSRVFPLVITDPTTTSIAVFALVFMVAASRWNIFSGYSGYLALGHAVFFGSGGYAVALAARDWHVAGGWAGVRPAAVRRPRRRAGRDPGRAGRAAHPPPHVRRGDDRDLLHLPAGRVQPRLHRRHLGHHAARSPRSRPPTTTSPSTTSRWSILVADGGRLVGGAPLAVRPAAAGDPRRRGPRARPRRQDPPRQADRVRALGDPGRDGRRPVLLLPRPDLSRSSRSTRCSTSRSR